MYATKVIKDKLIVPKWSFEDTPVSDDFIISEEFYGYVTTMDYNVYKNIKRRTYFACRWYQHLIDNSVPTILSILKKTTPLDLREDLKELLIERKFVRLCGASPKDVLEVPIFKDYNKAADSIMTSERTLKVMKEFGHTVGSSLDEMYTHLFIRDVVNIKIEARCFIHRHKLRAISVYQCIPLNERKEYEELILDFFELYIDKMLYNSTIVEIGLDDGFPFVIEFNDYGIDGFAGASLFDWDIDTEILYNSIIPEFRYPNEYSF